MQQMNMYALARPLHAKHLRGSPILSFPSMTPSICENPQNWTCKKYSKKILQASEASWTACTWAGKTVRHPGKFNIMGKRRSQRLFWKLLPQRTNGSGIPSLEHLGRTTTSTYWIDHLFLMTCLLVVHTQSISRLKIINSPTRITYVMGYTHLGLYSSN